MPFPGGTFIPQAHPVQSFLLAPIIFAVYAVPIAYCIEVVLGIPAWLIFRHYRIRSFRAFAAGGGLIGLIFYFTSRILEYVFSPSNWQFRRENHISNNPFSDPYLYFLVFGAMASALLFRAAVFRRERPETAD